MHRLQKTRIEPIYKKSRESTLRPTTINSQLLKRLLIEIQNVLPDRFICEKRILRERTPCCNLKLF